MSIYYENFGDWYKETFTYGTYYYAYIAADKVMKRYGSLSAVPGSVSVAATAESVCVCYVYRYKPAVAAVPEVRVVTDLTGWNAKARSTRKLGGNCFTEFSVPFVTGAVVGLTDVHDSTDPRRLPHAFYVYALNGTYYYCVYEYGIKKTAPVLHTSVDTVFRIDRKKTNIRYYVDNQLIYTSPAFSAGDLIVGACLYGNNDGVN